MELEKIRIAALNAAIAIGFNLETDVTSTDGRGEETTTRSNTQTSLLRVVDVADLLTEWIQTGDMPNTEPLF